MKRKLKFHVRLCKDCIEKIKRQGYMDILYNGQIPFEQLIIFETDTHCYCDRSGGGGGIMV